MNGKTGADAAALRLRAGRFCVAELIIPAMLEEYDTVVIGLMLVPLTFGARGSGATACPIGAVDTGVGNAGVGNTAVDVASYNFHGESLLVVSVIVAGTIS